MEPFKTDYWSLHVSFLLMQVSVWEKDENPVATPDIFAPFDLAGKPIFVTIPMSEEKDSEAKMVADRKDET